MKRASKSRKAEAVGRSLHTVVGASVFFFLILSWWFDHRGFLHGMAVAFQAWWLWSIRPYRPCTKEELYEAQYDHEYQ